jgi:large subunit ribosomal protein L13
MKIIDAKEAILGRLASFVAKELLKGEKIVIVNCKDAIISGNRKFIEARYLEKKSKVGTAQKGPKVSRLPHLIVKRVIRGMLPDHREGRGRAALNNLRCYATIPKEFETKEKIKFDSKFKGKHIKVEEVYHG